MAGNGGQRRTGGCQCGAVRYEVATGDEDEVYVCHCRECQKQSSSAFGISFMAEKAAFRLTRGSVRSWERDTDTGRRLACMFCPDCGSRLWHEAAGGGEVIAIKGGSLDLAPDLGRAIHIWTKRKMPGVAIPEGARQFPGEPA